jgi:hypothetical protein
VRGPLNLAQNLVPFLNGIHATFELAVEVIELSEVGVYLAETTHYFDTKIPDLGTSLTIVRPVEQDAGQDRYKRDSDNHNIVHSRLHSR